VQSQRERGQLQLLIKPNRPAQAIGRGQTLAVLVSPVHYSSDVDPHEYGGDRNGIYPIDLARSCRLLFCPARRESPTTPAGNIDLNIATYILDYWCLKKTADRPCYTCLPTRQSTAGRTAMKTKNPLTVRPDSGSGLAELKRAKSLIRLTESVLGKSIAPARNRTDEQGRKQGYWVEHVGSDVYEGEYVDGKEQGHWVLRLADGDVWEGPFVCGELHGHWVGWNAKGDAGGGAFVEGEQHGHWVDWDANGQVEEGQYVDGKKHGKWVVRDADGDVFETCFENGKKVDC